MSMFVALDPNGQLITIENAIRGLACNCTCACCGEPVVARKGLIREHHFSHHSNKESCFIQRESLLHLYAKQVIRNKLGLQLPPMPGTCSESEDQTSWWDFEGVDEEVPQPGFQPDLVAHLRDGSQLFIEIAVTSFIDEEKLERIKTVGINTVEIDLSELLFNKQPVPSEEVAAHILKQTHNKSWIYPEPPRQPLPYAMDWQSILAKPLVAKPQAKCLEHRFTIMGMWVSARELPTGSIAVRSWSFNPQITELLKSWRNELGGEYNPKFKNWIYYPRSREEVLNRLKQLDEAP
ncbi:competence protein CoiA family protein [Pseudomonas jinjuensis]|uniref:Competence protein CoiA-like family protein n=1 Tax=Pseudomonas jinjuensis TaxID=198616 RepID=A0A1H0IWE5_9PSED|nr:competence protein CoiA family protein [Pseudomonas jinjuensis]SDO35767.1 Competence protein CoiA-like family protein [Pseudomonas jinjuensis]